MHNGIDIGAAYGTDIYASDGGIVIISEYSYSYGNYVMINHGDGRSTLYAHMSKRLVEVDDTVSQGDVIGLVGSTGYSTDRISILRFELTISSQTRCSSSQITQSGTKRMIRKKIIMSVIILLAIAILLTYGLVMFKLGMKTDDNKYTDSDKLAEAVGIIEEYYIGDYDSSAVTDAAIEAMLTKLGDRWSYY